MLGTLKAADTTLAADVLGTIKALDTANAADVLGTSIAADVFTSVGGDDPNTWQETIFDPGNIIVDPPYVTGVGGLLGGLGGRLRPLVLAGASALGGEAAEGDEGEDGNGVIAELEIGDRGPTGRARQPRSRAGGTAPDHRVIVPSRSLGRRPARPTWSRRPHQLSSDQRRSSP